MRRYIILLISFALLSCSPVSKYRSLPEVQFWEADIQKFEQLYKTEKYPEDAVLFAGSSSIRLWTSLGKDMAPYTFRKTHPSTPVFWIEITPTASRWKAWPEIQKANALIKEICSKQKNTYFITTSYAFLNETGLPKDELFRDDQLHLTEKGYAVWTSIIRKEIDSVFKK